MKDQARKARVQARMAKLQQEKQEQEKQGQEAEPAARKFQPFGAPKKKEDAVRVFTEEELAGHTTVESGLFLAARGQVFDVSTGKDFYGPEKSYHFFCGRDASRGLVQSAHEMQNHTVVLPFAIFRVDNSFSLRQPSNLTLLGLFRIFIRK